MNQPTPPVVQLTALSRVFEGPAPVNALREVDLVIAPGDYVSIVGPSGSGKSTLLHLLGLLDRPSEGTYLLDGLDVSTLSDAERTAVRGRRIGFVFQAFHLLGHRTVLDNVVLAQLYNGTPASERRELARAALERVGLGHRVNFSPNTLSGGERQRVAIARAIVSRPSLLLADEPTGNLDTVTGASVLELFDEFHDEGLTVVMITHDVDVSRRAVTTYRMSDGWLSQDHQR